jgi:hypothetical protein
VVHDIRYDKETLRCNKVDDIYAYGFPSAGSPGTVVLDNVPCGRTLGVYCHGALRTCALSCTSFWAAVAELHWQLIRMADASWWTHVCNASGADCSVMRICSMSWPCAGHTCVRVYQCAPEQRGCAQHLRSCTEPVHNDESTTVRANSCHFNMGL